MTITPLDGHTITYAGVTLNVDDIQENVVVNDHEITGVCKPTPSGLPHIPENIYMLLYTIEPDEGAEIESNTVEYGGEEYPILSMGYGNLGAFLPNTGGTMIVVSTDGVHTLREEFSLSGLTRVEP